MADLIFTPSGTDGFVNAFERQVVEELCRLLPAHWKVAANFTLKPPRNQRALEMDAVVFADATIFVVEAKGWSGRVVGDDQEWEVGKRPMKCPLLLVNTKSKVLASMLEDHKASVDTVPLLVVPDGVALALHGNWAEHALHLREIAGWMVARDAGAGRRGEAPEKAAARMRRAVAFMQGRWAIRNRSERRRVGPYEVLETLDRDEQGGVFLAVHGQFADDANRYRVRTWQVAPSAAADGTDRQLRWMFRSAEARQRIGDHANVVGVHFFEFDAVESEFVEVTDWPTGGSLHRFLESGAALGAPLAQRLGIALGLAEALKACHAAGVVHRNVQPKAVLLSETGVARLTDFERAHVEGETTVYSDSRGRVDAAYLAPELQSVHALAATPDADCYALGVILYQLLTHHLPFEDAAAAAAASGLPAKLPSERAAGISPQLDELVVGLLHSGASRNRPTADEVVRRLRALLHPATAASPAAPAPVAPPVIGVGDLLEGKWRLDAVLGKGGFSTVFRAHQLHQKADYALKVFTDLDDHELVLHEFNQIRPRIPVHPNLRQIVWLDRLGPPHGNLYMVAELVEGEPLTRWTQGEREMPWAQKRAVAEGLLAALAAVHAAGIVHRDIKPANVLVEQATGRALLIDFNVASATSMRQAGLGTRVYRAPDVDRFGWTPHADLFSLGIVLFELFFGTHPFVDVPLGKPARSPRQVVGFSKVSDATVAFFERALQPDAEQRFRRATEMLQALPKDLFATADDVGTASLVPVSTGRSELAAGAAPADARRAGWWRPALGVALLAAGGVIGAKLLLGTDAPAPSPAPEVAPAAPPLPAARFDARGCPDGFVRIPAGSFEMGQSPTDGSGYEDERPAHTVVISRDFCMQQHEVTRAAWRRQMGSDPSEAPSCGEDCPVDSVTWRDAVDFANAVSRSEGLPACYLGNGFAGLDCRGYRLPTEAEWEYAARDGQGKVSTRALEETAWFRGNANDRPHPVGLLQPNERGLFDMLGNVWEWTNDRYGPYPEDRAIDPTGSTLGGFRVRRGGAWNSFPKVARVGNRGSSLAQTQRAETTGLRLVVLPKE